MLKNKDCSLDNCVRLSVTPSRLGSANWFSVYIWSFLPKFVKGIAKEQAHGAQKSKGLLDFGYFPLFLRTIFQMGFAPRNYFSLVRWRPRSRVAFFPALFTTDFWPKRETAHSLERTCCCLQTELNEKFCSSFNSPKRLPSAFGLGQHFNGLLRKIVTLFGTFANMLI